MAEIKVCLYKENSHILKRNKEGDWFLDDKKIPQETAVRELVDAVNDLGYWCQVAKDVLPKEYFDMVQESYEYHEN